MDTLTLIPHNIFNSYTKLLEFRRSPSMKLSKSSTGFDFRILAWYVWSTLYYGDNNVNFNHHHKLGQTSHKGMQRILFLHFECIYDIVEKI